MNIQISFITGTNDTVHIYSDERASIKASDLHLDYVRWNPMVRYPRWIHTAVLERIWQRNPDNFRALDNTTASYEDGNKRLYTKNGISPKQILHEFLSDFWNTAAKELERDQKIPHRRNNSFQRIGTMQYTRFIDPIPSPPSEYMDTRNFLHEYLQAI